MSTEDQFGGTPPSDHPQSTTSGGAFDAVPWGASSVPTGTDGPSLVSSPGSSFLSTDRTSAANDLTPQQRTARTIMRVVGPVLLIGGMAAVASGFTSFADDSPFDGGGSDTSEIVFTDEDGNVIDEEGNPVLDEDGNPVTEDDEWVSDDWASDDWDSDDRSDEGGGSSDDNSLGLFIGGGVASMAGLFLTGLGWGGSLNQYQVNSNAGALRDASRHLGLGNGTSGAPPTPASTQAIEGAGGTAGTTTATGPYCRECGKQATDDLQPFCSSCGRSLG